MNSLKFSSSTNIIRITILFPISLLLFLFSILTFSLNKTVIISWEFIYLSSSIFSLPLIIDSIGLIFSTTVLFISANVLLFSQSYMFNEKFKSRFTLLVLLFIISINLLIFIPNFISLILGWDGLGLVRFLLVIYYQNNKSLAAGILTALTNRIGDVLILISIAWVISQGHWQIINIWTFDLYSPNLIIIFILFAAITKRAQIPFSAWLPAAIAAPTPVSALVHSSTLVTAGVFLILRFHYFLSSFLWFNLILTISGILTIIIAGTIAIIEIDIKKIIALSTLRQLGVIILTLGINLPNLAFFHLITHALFKALLFICAGSLINLNMHAQDLREKGNLALQIPTLISAILIANTALCGIPFISGFYSKDFIIESSLFINFNIIISFIFLLATILTAIYSSRFIILISLSSTNKPPLSNIHDKDLFSSIAAVLLSIGAISAGIIVNWILIYPIIEPILNNIIKISALIVTFTGTIIIIVIFSSSFTIKSHYIKIKKLHIHISTIWSLTPSSTQFIISIPITQSFYSLKLLDQGWFEFLGPQNIFSISIILSKKLLLLQKILYNSIIILSFSAIIFIILLK